MLSVKNLQKTFHNTVAVSNLSFDISEPGLIALLGLNGAGKTTLLKMLSTYLPPDQGNLELFGLSYEKNKIDVQKLIGYVPDRPALYPEMKVYEYLKYFGSIRGLDKRYLAQRLEIVLEETHLNSVRNKLCKQLSRGYAQRVCLAQAILHEPKFLILDEPTIGLDPEQVRQFRNLAQKYARTSIVLFSSHSLLDVAEICSSVLIIHNGVLRTKLKLTGQAAHELENVFINCLTTSSVSSEKNFDQLKIA